MTGYTRAAAEQAIDLLRTTTASYRSLNARVAVLMDLAPQHYEPVSSPGGPDYFDIVWKKERPFVYNEGRPWRAPDLTGSLDAAHAVAPEGWFLLVDTMFHDDAGLVTFQSFALKPDWSRWNPSGRDEWIARIGPINAAKPAPAILAAAIAALAHDHGDIIIQGDGR